MPLDDEEDDYLSDKFLTGLPTASSSSTARSTKTYSESRQLKLRLSEAKNAASRKKSSREIVEDGLNTSLFEKAQEQEAEGRGKNKALAMMLKMGFKPGEALGRSSTISESSSKVSTSKDLAGEASRSVSSHSTLLADTPLP